VVRVNEPSAWQQRHRDFTILPRMAMRAERLVAMANDISAFFAAGGDRAEAARHVATHLERFWDPRMRREIIAHYGGGGEGLHDVARDAVAILASEQ
jgi:formate dehydrogenase subunit delta